MSRRILLSDDNAEFIALCAEEAFASRGYEVDQAPSPRECLEMLERKSYDLLVLDIDFGKNQPTGTSLLPEIRRLYPTLLILMHSNSSQPETVAQTRIGGAHDFVGKGYSISELTSRIDSLIDSRLQDKAIADEGAALAARTGAVFASQEIAEIFKFLARLRKSPEVNVLIRGETGAGKELIAEALSRQDEARPFVTVNCAAIQPGLVESVLFGHMRGSFTGALRDHKGKFEEANGGDIFLDEVACLPLNAQTALLRVIEKQEICPVGAKQSRNLSFRVISATNEDLEELVRQGKFREELLARLAGKTITLPSLRQRPEDIQPILEAVIQKSARPQAAVSPDCLDLFKSYRWPKNVRQLRQTVLTMVASATSDTLSLRDVPMEIFHDILPKTMKENRSEAGELSSGGSIVVDVPIAEVGWEEALKCFTDALIKAKRERLGSQTTQTALAASLKIPRSRLQRLLRADRRA